MNFFIRVILIGIGFGAIIMISLAVTQETYRRYQIQKEIDELRYQAEKKERDNQRLKGVIEYFKTSDFQEKEAKEKLSVQKEGEKMIVVKEESKQNPNSKETEENKGVKSKEDKRSNPKKWWDYFFTS